VIQPLKLKIININKCRFDSAFSAREAISKIIFFTVLISTSFSFQSDDKIPYKENSLLTWADFKGRPDASSPYKALTETMVTIDVKTKGNEAVLTIQNYFQKNLSWTKDKNNNNLLSHEQTHFNITEVWTRRFRQKLKGKTFEIKTFQRELNAMHSEIHKESKAMQAEYDKETEHSVNEANQQKWNKKITNELQKLSSFSSIEVSCKLSK